MDYMLTNTVIFLNNWCDHRLKWMGLAGGQEGS